MVAVKGLIDDEVFQGFAVLCYADEAVEVAFEVAVVLFHGAKIGIFVFVLFLGGIVDSLDCFLQFRRIYTIFVMKRLWRHGFEDRWGRGYGAGNGRSRYVQTGFNRFDSYCGEFR